MNLTAAGRLCLGILLILTVSGCQQASLHQRQFLQFGTIIDISLLSPDAQAAEKAFSDIDHLLRQRHQQWHAWRPGTLQDFNNALARHPASAVEIPPQLDHLIRLSREYYDLSEGLFNPALGKLVEAWGFHQEQPPDKALIADIQRDIPDMWDLLLEGNHALSLNPHLQLDFGAVAKGTAIKQIAGLLRQQQYRHFIINAGGDIYAEGQKHQRRWRVAIENPYREGIIATLELPPAMSIFTSGNYRRYYLDQNQQRRHHIIDPRSGQPSKQISAATVMHTDPEIADIAATTLMLTDIPRIKIIAQKLGIVDFLVLTEEKHAYISKSMLKKITWQQTNSLNINEL